MDGIYSSKDPLINTCEYWQIYDPFTRLYDNIFFKTCIKKGRVTYLQEYKPTKQFMEDNELSESTELVICKLRIKRILKDKNKTNKEKASEILDVLISYPLASVMADVIIKIGKKYFSKTDDVEKETNQTTSNTYLINEFIDDIAPIINGLDRTLYNDVFTDEDSIISLINYCDKKFNVENTEVSEVQNL